MKQLKLLLAFFALIMTVLIAGCGTDSSSGAGGGDNHGDSVSAASTIALNSITAASINPVGDNDYFRIEITESGTLVLYTEGDTDTYGYLLDASGNIMDEDDDDNGDLNFRISHEVTPGTYYIRVMGFDDTETGDYSLRVVFATGAGGGDHGDSVSAASTIALNSITAASINPVGDNDYFRIEITRKWYPNALYRRGH